MCLWVYICYFILSLIISLSVSPQSSFIFPIFLFLFLPLFALQNVSLLSIQKQPPEVFCEKVFLEISQNSQESTCARVSFLIKWHRCFPVNFVKFLKTPFFKEHLWWLLLNVIWKIIVIINTRIKKTMS